MNAYAKVRSPVPGMLTLQPIVCALVLLFSVTVTFWNVAAHAATQLTLTWLDNATNEEGFKIERKADLDPAFSQVAVVSANVVSYIDFGLAEGTTYCYRLRAFNGAGDSAYSNDACTTTSINNLPNPPLSDQPLFRMVTRIGVFRPSTGQWFLDLNGNGQWDECQIDGCLAPFGQQGDLPVIGDWNGTGTDKIGLFRSRTASWNLDRNGNDRWEDCTVDLCVRRFGRSGDQPVVGHWNGAGPDQLGVFRASRRKTSWQLDTNGNGKFNRCSTDSCPGPFGQKGDQAVAGDWTGTGMSQIGTLTPSTGVWKLDRNGNGQFDDCAVDVCLGPFGLTGDLAVVGDWTGTGTAKIGVFDQTTAMWEFDLNGNGAWDGCAEDGCFGPFGLPGDLPVVGRW